jgi:hypothetical protein
MNLQALMPALLLTSLLVGCGTPQGLAPLPSNTPLEAASHPGWGQKTWTTLLVPGEVMGYAAAEVAELRKEFERSYGSTGPHRLRIEVTLVASRDGFKTSARSSMQVPPDSAMAREFELGALPKGEYAYYLTVTGQAIEYDAANRFRGIVKVFAPRPISNFGRNFRGEVR